jgi:hypothetical protein
MAGPLDLGRSVDRVDGWLCGRGTRHRDSELAFAASMQNWGLWDVTKVALREEIEPECVAGRMVESEVRLADGAELNYSEAPDELGRLVLCLQKGWACISSKLTVELVLLVLGRDIGRIDREL